jgi:hypothetical protein
MGLCLFSKFKTDIERLNIVFIATWYSLLKLKNLTFFVSAVYYNNVKRLSLLDYILYHKLMRYVRMA